ncbi:fibrinogen-like protein 1 isoform X1 [Mytilus edulis]|uniref:fibrinogen-like protein 1 isoform X1 n=2 Tax=Mytilus edulis TaxID=6550 RepID=UPI0039EEF38D
MYHCKMFRLMIILQLSFASFGFLLNTKAPSSSNGNNQYITVAEYYADKASLRHEMDRTLNLLTSQIEQRLFQMQSPTDAIERKYNETFENLMTVSAKLETTEAKYKFLEQKYATLEKVVQHLENELTLGKNNLRDVKVRLTNIEQSKSINQILELNQMREKIKLMENSVNQLQGNEQSRSQDFLALYNITLIEKNNIAKLQHKTELQENYLAEQNATYSKEISILHGRAGNHDNQLLILKNETEAQGHQLYLQNQNCTDQINYLQNKTNQQDQQFTSILTEIGRMNETTHTEMLRFKKVQAKQVSGTECKDIVGVKSDINTVSPDQLHTFKVLCEDENWTVIQKRFDGSTEFYRNWEDYENGFGDLNREFWLGNRNIALLTSIGTHELKINLEDWDGSKRYANFKNFKIDGASDKYRLNISGYSGNAGDGMTEYNGYYFSTYDRDHDTRPDMNCAAYAIIKGAWWFYSCWTGNGASLNGKYTSGPSSSAGIRYKAWKYQSLKKSTMMIRKV